MTRRRGIQVGLALIVVLAVTLSGFKVQQAFSESQAHAHFVSARAGALAELKHAGSIGLLPGELRPYRVRLTSLEGAPSPNSNAIWDTSTTRFYDRQAQSYRLLTAELRRGEREIAHQTDVQARRDLNRLATGSRTASSLGLDASRYAIILRRQQSALARAEESVPQLPSRFRSISSKVVPQAAALESTIGARQRYLSSVVARGGNSVSGVQGIADAETNTARGQVSLLGLLTARATRYSTILTSLNASVHTQTTVQSAAVQEARLHDAISVISADVNKTIPAKMIVVSTEAQSATLYQNGQQIYSTLATTGGPELPTDHGVFHIYAKISPFVFHSPWPESSPYYYPPSPVQWWMPFDGGEGLHDAPWRSNFGPGSNLQPTDLGGGRSILGTHGCVNLPTPAAQYVWDWAPLGTTVVVV